MKELIQRVKESEKRSTRNLVIVMIVCLLLVGVLIWGVFTDPLATSLVKGLAGLFALGLVCLVVLFARKVFTKDSLALRLEKNPDQFVEVSVREVLTPKGAPTYQKNLYFKTSGGKQYFLTDRRSKIDALLPLLKKELKIVKFGIREI